MKRILITGAGGMIGTALTELALSKGATVTAVLRNGSDKLSRIKSDRLKVLYCDLSETDKIKTDEKQDAFIHLGWASTFGDERNDTVTQAKNIEYTLKAVQAAVNNGCSVFVSVGSQAEYGPTTQVLNSDTPINPVNGYGIAKYAAGKLSEIMCRQNGIRHCHARILSVYGGRDRDATLISSCIDSMLCGESPSLTGCEQMWDYLYADDAANALWLIAEKGKDTAVYCVGSGEKRLLRDYVEIIKKETGYEGTVRYFERPYAKDQVMFLCADISSLHRDTGFVPAVSFEEGIRRTVSFRKGRIGK